MPDAPVDAPVDAYVRDWPTTRLADSLRWQLRSIWRVVEPNLRGLTDDEYFWEPVPGCWSVRRRDETQAPLVWGKGEWVVENSWTPPSPPPVTTVAWRLMHAYDCWSDFFSRGMQGGPPEWAGSRDWNDIEVPGHAEGAVAMVADLRARIDATLAAVDDEVLRAHAPGDPRPAWTHVTYSWLEATHHCAEVGVLRDLYRTRPTA